MAGTQRKESEPMVYRYPMKLKRAVVSETPMPIKRADAEVVTRDDEASQRILKSTVEGERAKLSETPM
jgi:hypothetical protein